MSIIKKIIRYPITLSHYLLKLLFYLAGYNLQIKYKKRILTNEINKLNLNIGAGNYIIDGFKSLDLYSKHYYPDKNSFLKVAVGKSALACLFCEHGWPAS